MKHTRKLHSSLAVGRLTLVAAVLLSGAALWSQTYLSKEYVYVGGRLIAVEVAGASESLDIAATPSATIDVAGGTVNLQATVGGVSSPVVVWSQPPGSSGAVASSGDLTGVFTAPSPLPVNSEVVTVTGAVTGTNLTATIDITISGSGTPPGLLGLSPSVASVAAGGQATFEARRNGSLTAATWSLTGGGGLTPSSGLVDTVTYDAPGSITCGSVVTVTATEGGQSANADITLACPDLRFSGVTATDLVAPDGDVVVDYNVDTGGFDVASAFDAKFYLDPPAGSPLPLGTRSFGSGLVAGVQAFTSQFPLPAGAVAGTSYTLRAVLDESDAIVEADEDNNVDVTETVAVDQPASSGPDLVITSFTLDSQSAEAGDSVGFDITVRNQGDQCAEGAFVARVYLSTTPDPLSDPGAVTESCSFGLAASACGTPAAGLPVSSVAQCSSSILPPGVGAFYLVARVDDPPVVVGENTANNIASVGGGTLVVTPQIGLGVDFRAPGSLVQSALQFPATAELGEVVDIRGYFDWANDNMNPGEVVRTGVYFTSPSATLSTSDQLVASMEFPDSYQGFWVDCTPALCSGLVATFRVGGSNVQIPSGISPGTYRLGIITDDLFQIAEEDETNNSYTTPTALITITAPPNQAPNVTLNAPTGGPFEAPADIAFSATATDPEGSMDRVEFLRDGVLLGASTSATSAYAFAWNGVAAGTYSVVARAFDTVGDHADSDPVIVTVSDPPGLAPDAAISAISTVDLAVSGIFTADGSGSTDPDTPLVDLSYAWNYCGGPEQSGSIFANPNVATTSATLTAPGSHCIELTVSDPGGLSDVATVQVTAVGLPVPPQITLSSPASGANYSSAAVPVKYSVTPGGAQVTGCELSLETNTPIPYPDCASTVLSYVHLSDPSMILAYDFAESSGSVARDRGVDHAEDNSSEIFSATSAVDPLHYGAHVTFNGTDQGIEPLSPAGQALHAPFTARTFEAWIKPTDASTIQTVFEEGGNYSGLHLGIDGGQLRLTVRSENDPDSVQTPLDVTGTPWRHVAAVFDGAAQEIRLYVDGELKDSAATAYSNVGGTQDHTDDPGLGRTVGGGDSTGYLGSARHYNGAMDEVAIYSRALSAAEIQGHYARTYLPTSNSITVSAADGVQTVSGSANFTVNAGGSCTYQLSDASQNFVSTGGGHSFTVTADVDCPVSLTNSSFITITTAPPALGTGNPETVAYSIGINPDSTPRNDGNITINGEVHTVTQDANQQPTFSGLTTQNVIEGQSVSIDVAPAANDPEGENLTFTLAPTSVALPSSLSLSSAGLISGVPDGGTAGSYALTIRATDPAGNFADAGFTLNVTTPAGSGYVTDELRLHYDLTNHAPGPVVVDEVISDPSGIGPSGLVKDAGANGSWTGLGLQGASIVTAATSFGPTKLSAVDNESFTIIWVGTFGTENLTHLYRYSDGSSRNVSMEWRYGQWIYPSLHGALDNGTSRSDLNGETALYVMRCESGGCEWRIWTTNAWAAAVLGTDPAAQAPTLEIGRGSTYWEVVNSSTSLFWIYSKRLSDAEIQQNFDHAGGVLGANLLGYTGPSNSPPSFSPDPPNRTDTEGDVITYVLSASDPETDPLTYAIVSGTPPTGLTFDGNTGTFSGTIATGAAANSPYPLVVSVSDGVNPAVAAPAFDWVVNASSGPGPPSVSISAPSPGAQVSAANVPIVYSATAGDNPIDYCEMSVGGGPAMRYPTCVSTTLSYVHLTDAAKFLAYDFAEGATDTAYDRAADGEDNDGLLQGPAAATSPTHGSALAFDGVDDRIVPTSDDPGALHDAFNARSFEAWFKADSITGNHTLYDEGGWVNGFHLGLVAGSPSYLRFSTQTDDSPPQRVDYPFSDTSGWHHVAAVFDNATMHLYLDGALVGTLANTGFSTVNPHSHNAGVGATVQYNSENFVGDGNYFHGKMDEIAIYQRVLSAAEIADHYNNAYYDGPISVAISATDTSSVVDTATVNFTVNGSPTCAYSLSTYSATPASLGAGYSVDVTTQAACPITITPSGSWITITGTPPTSGTGAAQTITYNVSTNPLATSRPGSINVNGEVLSLNQDPNQAPSFPSAPGPQSHQEGTTIMPFSVTATDPESDLLTYSASGAPAGVTFDTDNGTFSGTIDGGAGQATPYSVVVSVSDGINSPVQAASFAWTVTEVGDPAPTVSITSPTAGQSFADTSNLPLTWTATDNVGIQSCDLELDGSGIVMPYPNCVAGTNTTQLTYVHAPDASKILALDFADGAGSTTAYDRSGNGHDLAAVNNPTFAAGRYGDGVTLNGAEQYFEDADAENYINGLTAVTVAAWIKSDVTGVNRGVILADDPTTLHGLGIRYDSAGINGGGTNVIQAGVEVDGNRIFIESSSNIQTTDWQHVVLTWESGGQPKLYLDGLEDTPTFVGGARSGAISAATKLIIGQGAQDSGSSDGWDGQIDEVAIYNRALTAQEIAALYNDSALSSGVNHTLRVRAYDTAAQPSNDASVTFSIDQAPPSVVGIIELEAEDATIINRAQSWITESTLADYSGTGYLTTSTNTDVKNETGEYVGVSPEVQFTAHFPSAGDYYVWVRGNGPTNSDDTIHIGLNGAAVASGDTVYTFDPGSGGWTWAGTGHISKSRVLLTIPSAGNHTINAWMREDGFRFDKIAIADAESLYPVWEESNGHFGVEAEFADINNNSGSDDWELHTNHSSYWGTGFLNALPDGTPSQGAGSHPRFSFTVNFTQTGTYYVWLRGTAEANGNSVWVGVDGGNWKNVEFNGGTGFHWTDDLDDGSSPPLPRATINISSPGPHDIVVSVREDNTRVDRVVINQNAGFTPSTF